MEKPAGPSSHAVATAFADGARACHGGALDPFAEGLLLVLVGDATRLFPYLHAVPKVYEADVAWGAETDTGDAGGTVVATAPPPGAPPAFDAFVGWHDQVPPATSNRRVAGERAWVRAHRGEEVELSPSPVYLHAGAWLGPSRLRIVVRGGFYVRAFVRDLARAAGTRAHVRTLRRTRIGPWTPGPTPVRVQGMGLLPWLPAVVDGVLRPPTWPLPSGFPGDALTRRIEAGRLVGLVGEGVDLRVRPL